MCSFFFASCYSYDQSRSQNHLDDTKFGGLSSSSEEFTSPIPNQQMYPNHQFSPTPNNIYQNLPTHPQRSQPMPILNHHPNHQQHYGQAQGHHYGGQASQGQHYGGQVSQGGQYREYRTLPPNHGSRLGGRHAGPASRPGKPDSLGNIIILPKQFEVGLCQGCHNIFDGGAPPDVQHHRQHPPPIHQVCHSRLKSKKSAKGSRTLYPKGRSRKYFTHP